MAVLNLQIFNILSDLFNCLMQVLQYFPIFLTGMNIFWFTEKPGNPVQKSVIHL